jgi:hypothetical protein
VNLAAQLPPTDLRVERATPDAVNAATKTRADARIARLESAGPAAIAARTAELDREWDVERLLQLNASTLVLAGTLLGARVDRRFLLLPFAVCSFLAQHAVQGWCPPLPIFRRAGVRTTREIERERYALKALRGDFDPVPGPETANATERVRAVIASVDT